MDSQVPDSELAQQFYCILLTKVSHKASPDSQVLPCETPTLNGKSCNITVQTVATQGGVSVSVISYAKLRPKESTGVNQAKGERELRTAGKGPEAGRNRRHFSKSGKSE